MYSHFGPSHSEQPITGFLQTDHGLVQNPTFSDSDDPFHNFLFHTSNPNDIPDFPDACLKFINDILMEEDSLHDRPATLQQYHALRATEQSLYDALGPHNSDLVESCSLSDQTLSSNAASISRDFADSPVSTLFAAETDLLPLQGFVNGSRGRKNHERDSISMGEVEEGRRSKQMASSNEEYVEMERFDDVLICEEGKDDISPCSRKNTGNEVGGGSLLIEFAEISKGSKSRRKSKRKSNKGGDVVDLRNLLIQCATAVASFDLINANELLKQIRQHASEFGDSVQRVAYYFANGLEARLAGTGSDLYRDFVGKPISSAEILKGYQLYVSAVPFQRTSYFLANQTIAKLAANATKIHIIDFGIFFGFQWPCLIQLLSRRRGGPPRIRITGVDFPQSGLKPAKKIEETGSRLAGYCERFGVPFEFQAIAQRWHTLKPKDFKIEEDELVVVSCLYQSRKLPDESVEIDSPRDCFLKLIKSLNPKLFIHGVVNGTFNAPFFITRFREALYHYSALFDVFEATMPREDQERLLIERYLYGKDVMNIVACEGSERIERPESYKQWQMRHLRVGFTQVGLDQDVVNRARAMVKANYHKDIMVDQDRHWMVQGWKGRILSAVSCWKPA